MKPSPTYIITPRSQPKLSSNIVIAIYGFLILASIGIFFSFSPKFIRPLLLMINTGKVEAVLENEYTEYQSSRRGITMTSFNIKYKFEIDGKQYSGRDVTGIQPDKIMIVEYDRRNPHINGTELSSRAYIDMGLFFILLTVFAVCVIVLFAHYQGHGQKK